MEGWRLREAGLLTEGGEVVEMVHSVVVPVAVVVAVVVVVVVVEVVVAVVVVVVAEVVEVVVDFVVVLVVFVVVLVVVKAQGTAAVWPAGEPLLREEWSAGRGSLSAVRTPEWAGHSAGAVAAAVE